MFECCIAVFVCVTLLGCCIVVFGCCTLVGCCTLLGWCTLCGCCTLLGRPMAPTDMPTLAQHTLSNHGDGLRYNTHDLGHIIIKYKILSSYTPL